MKALVEAADRIADDSIPQIETELLDKKSELERMTSEESEPSSRLGNIQRCLSECRDQQRELQEKEDRDRRILLDTINASK